MAPPLRREPGNSAGRIGRRAGRLADRGHADLRGDLGRSRWRVSAVGLVAAAEVAGAVEHAAGMEDRYAMAGA